MTPRSHHYNPQVYLRQFVNPASRKQLWEFDLNQGTAKLSRPKDCGCEDFYHSVENAAGERDDGSIEQWFTDIENMLPKLFELIRNRQTLTQDAWTTLFLFASLQRSRCPKFLNSVQKGLSRMYSQVFEMLKYSPHFAAQLKAKGLDPDKVRNTEFEIIGNRDVALLSMLGAFGDGELTATLAQMSWAFLIAPPEKYFWTSDDPVCCWANREPSSAFYGIVGPANSDVELTFPLSRRTCALATWKSHPHGTFRTIPPEVVDGINARTLMNGWKFVYGPADDPVIHALVERIAKKRAEVAKPAA